MVERQRYRIAILGGTGAQGSGLALRLAAAGHDVTIGSRDAGKARATAAELAARAGRPIAGAHNRAAAGGAQVGLLTVPHPAPQATFGDVLDRLAGKLLVDSTVRLKPPGVGVVQLPEGQSAVAALQRRAGTAVRVVSAFQNVSAQHLKDLDHRLDCDVLICGDDPAA